MSADNAALIAALEAGPGSRELSDRVLVAAGGWRYPPGVGVNDASGWLIDPNNVARLPHARPDPTRNLQDILGLVPAPGCNHNLYSFIGHGRNDWPETAWAFTFNDRAQLMGIRAATEQIERMVREIPFMAKALCGPPRQKLERAIAEHFLEFHGEASTHALAVCIAVVKAQSHDE